MNCFGPPEAIVLLFGLLVACQLQVDGAGLKDAAKALAETAVKKAEETTEAPQVEGGVRSAVAHTALTMAAEKAIDVIGVKYPAIKPFAPLAKPLVGKAHNAINKMFTKKENTDEQPAAEGAADAADKPEQSEKETGGLLSKIKSAVGVGGPAKDADKAPAEPEKSADSEKPEAEDKKEKKPKDKRSKDKKPEEQKSEDKKPEEQKSEEKPEEQKSEEKKDEENKEAEKEVEEPGSKQEKKKDNKMAGGKKSAGRKG